MPDEGGDRVDGEEELAAPDWRLRAGPRNKPTQKERKEHEATHVQILVYTLHDGQRAHPSPHQQAKERRSVEKAHHCNGLLLHVNEVCCDCSDKVRYKHQNIMSSVALTKGVEEHVNN